MTTSIDDVFIKEPLDHEGTAKCVMALYPGLYKFVKSHGWFCYNGRFWEGDAEASVSRAIVNTLRKRDEVITSTIEDEKIARAMKKQVMANNWVVSGVKARLADQEEIADTITNFDKDNHLLNVNNGVIDLRTGDVEGHDKAQLFTYCLGIDYNQNSMCDEWLDFLTESVSVDEMADYLQIVAGYLLSGATTEEVLFYIYGPPRSGKGTFTEVILSVMDTLATGANFRMFTADRTGDTQNFDMAPLKNKRLIVAGESKRNERMNEAVLKQVTGGDNIYCAYKGRDHFSYRPHFKILLTSNYPANADPTDEAAWQRLRVIHFPHSKSGNEDKGLKNRLKSKESLEGVLSWMVSGAIAWHESGLPLPESVKNLTKAHKLLANSVAIFIDQCCAVTDGEFSAGTPLYHAYKDWCKEEGYSPYGRKGFTMVLTDLGVDSDRREVDGKTTRGFASISYLGYGMGSEFLSKNGNSNGHEVS